MKRAEIEKYMIENKLTQIDLVLNESDKLAIYCNLKNGKLKDYTDHVVDRKRDIWGRLVWNNGKAERRPW